MIENLEKMIGNLAKVEETDDKIKKRQKDKYFFNITLLNLNIKSNSSSFTAVCHLRRKLRRPKRSISGRFPVRQVVQGGQVGLVLLVDHRGRLHQVLLEVQQVLSGRVGRRHQQHQVVQEVPLDQHLRLAQDLQAVVVWIEQGCLVLQEVHRLRADQRVQRVQGVLVVRAGHRHLGGQGIRVGQCLQGGLGVLAVQRVQRGTVSTVAVESFRMGRLGLCRGLQGHQEHQVGQAFRYVQERQQGRGVQAGSIQSSFQMKSLNRSRRQSSQIDGQCG